MQLFNTTETLLLVSSLLGLSRGRARGYALRVAAAHRVRSASPYDGAAAVSDGRGLRLPGHSELDIQPLEAVERQASRRDGVPQILRRAQRT